MDTWAFLSVLLAVTHYGKKHLKLKMKKKHDFPHPTQVNYYNYTFVRCYVFNVSSVLSRKSEHFEGKMMMMIILYITSCSVRAEYNKVVHYF